jgi:predicted RNA-binding protein
MIFVNYYYLSQQTMSKVHTKPLNSRFHSKYLGESFMCEFNVILNGKTQFKDVVYAKSQDGDVMVKNVLGETKEFKGVVIVEVDVNSTKLVLATTNA